MLEDEQEEIRMRKGAVSREQIQVRKTGPRSRLWESRVKSSCR